MLKYYYLKLKVNKLRRAQRFHKKGKIRTIMVLRFMILRRLTIIQEMTKSNNQPVHSGEVILWNYNFVIGKKRKVKLQCLQDRNSSQHARSESVECTIWLLNRSYKVNCKNRINPPTIRLLLKTTHRLFWNGTSMELIVLPTVTPAVCI